MKNSLNDFAEMKLGMNGHKTNSEYSRAYDDSKEIIEVKLDDQPLKSRIIHLEEENRIYKNNQHEMAVRYDIISAEVRVIDTESSTTSSKSCSRKRSHTNR